MSYSERKPNNQPIRKIETERYTGSAPSILGIRRPPEGDYENAMKADGNQDTSRKQQHMAIRNLQEQTVPGMGGNTNGDQSTSLGDAKAVPMADGGGEVDPEPAVTSKENLHEDAPNNRQASTYEEMSERTSSMISQQAKDKRLQEQLVTSVTDKSLEVNVAEHGEDNSFQSSESNAEGGSLAVGLRNTSGVSDDMQMLNEGSSTETLSHSSETLNVCDSEGSGPGTSTSQFSRNNIPKVKEQREEKSPKVGQKQKKSTQSQHRMGRQISAPPPCRKSETARHPRTSRSQSLQIGAPSDWNEMERQCSQEFYDVFLLYSNSDVDKAIELTELLDHEKCTYREGFEAGKSIFQSLQEELDRCSYIVVLLTKAFVNDDKQRKFGDTSILKSLEDDDKKDFVIPVVYDLEDQKIPTAFKSIACLKKDNRFFDVTFLKSINKNKRRERIQEKLTKLEEAKEKKKEEDLIDEIKMLEEQLERKKRMDELIKTKLALQQQLRKQESSESDKFSPKCTNDCNDPCRRDQNSMHDGWVDDGDKAFTDGDDDVDHINGNIDDADHVNNEDQDHGAARRTSGTNSPQGVPGMKCGEQMQKTPSCGDSFTQNSPKSGDFDTKVEDQHDTEEAGNGKADDDEKITQDPTMAGRFERPHGQGDASCSPPSNQDVYDYGSEYDDLQRYSGLKSVPAYADPRNLLDPGQSGDAGGNIPFIDSELLPGTEPMNQSSKVTENNGCKSTAQSDVNGKINGSAENQRTHSTPPIPISIKVVPPNSPGSEQQCFFAERCNSRRH
ncbi:glutamic acid-rich protein-like isoform X2 [Ptychodera flava]|uniref:glutamic acid-rich protein-like isoform X2 n=1 Tax=Ptychodera flava TaxID=63121 RepID=UPI00396A9426